MRGARRLAALVSGAMLVLAACGGNTTTAPPPGGAAASDTGTGTGGGLSGKGGTQGGQGLGGVQPQGGGQPASQGSGPGGGAADRPPAWVRPGTRLTWYAAGASVAQSRYSWVEDPTGPWEDPKTGKRYRRTDEDGGTGQPGASGDGLSQLDVVAVEGSDVVLVSNLYPINRGSAQLSFLWTPVGGSRVHGASVEGSWIHPARLQQVLGQGFEGLLVLHGPYRLGTNTFDAVSFVNQGQNYSSYTYDLATGLLLAATTSTAGATSPFRAPGEDPPVGNTQLTITRFVALRERTMPGATAPLPAAVAGAGGIRYTGLWHWVNPIDPSSGNLTYPMETRVTFGGGGPTWRTFENRSVVAQLGEQPAQQGITSGNGPYGFDPATLAGLRAGDVLDRDPQTQEEVVVTDVGGSAVVIESRIPGVGQRFTYDARSGVLVGYISQLPASGISIELQLQGN